MAKLPTAAELKKLFDQGWTDRQLAEAYGVTVQAVNKRRQRITGGVLPVAQRVNAGLALRWKIYTTRGNDSHHVQHASKSLRAFLRRQLGDAELSSQQLALAARFEHRLRSAQTVLCYGPDGWAYRPRTTADGRRVIDWPDSVPYPDDPGFVAALDLAD
ncbi:hypothetical protein ACFRH6_23055 [Streptomyces sp. NPDC056749]|uniref:hypothetical protein n=1 Tax=Streptomyces sp. NPDC056749 TaxID=3345936 RepID=UPI00369F253A